MSTTLFQSSISIIEIWIFIIIFFESAVAPSTTWIPRIWMVAIGTTLISVRTSWWMVAIGTTPTSVWSPWMVAMGTIPSSVWLPWMVAMGTIQWLLVGLLTSHSIPMGSPRYISPDSRSCCVMLWHSSSS